ncbi:MAG: ECF transporter S component [Clostridia bacterium]|nr:ECF transporter S component [Clostridia bacterium]
MKKQRIKRLVLSAMLLAVGIVLPMLTSQIKEIGDTLLPMHIPVLLCGFICSASYGGAVGFLLPFIRSFIFSMPPLYPNAVWMALELMTYGAVSGIVYSKTRRKYLSLILAMLSGRIVWGIAKAVLLGIAGKSFGLAAFITGGFVDALLGIVIQLILIPLIVKAYERVNK